MMIAYRPNTWWPVILFIYLGLTPKMRMFKKRYEKQKNKCFILLLVILTETFINTFSEINIRFD